MSCYEPYSDECSLVACGQALRTSLAAGWERLWNIKSRCKMLIGGDGISNDVITLGTYFSMFVYIHTRFRFALIGGNLTAQSTGSNRGFGTGGARPGECSIFCGNYG